MVCYKSRLSLLSMCRPMVKYCIRQTSSLELNLMVKMHIKIHCLRRILSRSFPVKLLYSLRIMYKHVKVCVKLYSMSMSATLKKLLPRNFIKPNNKLCWSIKYGVPKWQQSTTQRYKRIIKIVNKTKRCSSCGY